jgi:hypothetical protein
MLLSFQIPAGLLLAYLGRGLLEMISAHSVYG